jgi:chromosomal replication initiation ATPase DnaA
MTKIIPRVILKRQDRVNYVLNGVCQFYNVSPQTLGARYRNTKLYDRKRIAVKALRDIADVTLFEVQMAFGANTPSQWSIWKCYDSINEDLSKGHNQNKELKAEYESLLKYLGV